MKILKDSFNIKVSFHKEDWNAGLARKCIAYLKENGAHYRGLTQQWHIKNTKEFREALEALREEYMPTEGRVQLELFNVDDWMEQFDESI